MTTAFRLILAAAALSLAACDSKPSPPAAPPSGGTASAPGAPAGGIKGAKGPGPVPVDAFNDRPTTPYKKGGEVVQAEQAGFRSLDGEQDNSATTSEVLNYVQEGLISSDVETWETKPALAERWDVEDNLELKDGKVVRGKVSEN
ncbi:MAG TPA: hypothetical protein VEJ18_13235, partial [Planctomycetota bacterium]|nr:hypothetical protein [Planctomycetota bacterium]